MSFIKINNMQKFSFLFLIFSLISLLSSTSSFSAETTRYGAVLICSSTQDINPTDVLPEVVFSAQDAKNGWKLLKDEAFTGVDAHRFYLTIESSQKDVPAPEIEVKWAGVKIERVIGAKSSFEKTDSGVRFIPAPKQAPTGSFTEISIGGIRLGVFHNWDVRRCGPYRTGDFPYEQVKSHLNYMLGALEVCRAYGWTDPNKVDFVDHVNLYGFETHFPNGHRDFPAHFHIMLGWDGWDAANVGHYLLDPNGKILRNTYWILHKDLEKSHLPGVVSCFTDKTGRDVFDTMILPDGSGLTFTKVGADDEYLLKEGAKGSAQSVVVFKRKTDSSEEWQKLCEVQASDDVEHGIFVSNAVYVDGSVQRLEFKYDPDTGAKL